MWSENISINGTPINPQLENSVINEYMPAAVLFWYFMNISLHMPKSRRKATVETAMTMAKSHSRLTLDMDWISAQSSSSNTHRELIISIGWHT